MHTKCSKINRSAPGILDKAERIRKRAGKQLFLASRTLNRARWERLLWELRDSHTCVGASDSSRKVGIPFSRSLLPRVYNCLFCEHSSSQAVLEEFYEDYPGKTCRSEKS